MTSGRSSSSMAYVWRASQIRLNRLSNVLMYGQKLFRLLIFLYCISRLKLWRCSLRKPSKAHLYDATQCRTGTRRTAGWVTRTTSAHLGRSCLGTSLRALPWAHTGEQYHALVAPCVSMLFKALICIYFLCVLYHPSRSFPT